MGGILIIAGCYFNRFRIAAILLASIPLLLIFVSYFLEDGPIRVRPVGFMGAAFAIVLSGIYHHLTISKLKGELELSLIEKTS